MTDIWEWPRAHSVEWDPDRGMHGPCYDGDTFRCFVDQGRGTSWARGTIRLSGIDTPEIRSSDELERERARAARDYLASLIPPGTSLALTSVGYDKYNDRCDAVVTRNRDGLVVNDEMVRAGFAVYKSFS